MDDTVHIMGILTAAVLLACSADRAPAAGVGRDQNMPASAEQTVGSRPINVVFIGDSITGAGYLPEVARPPAIAVAWLKHQSPSADIQMANDRNDAAVTT